MGRHSTGKNNYSLSKEVIAVLAVIALLIAAVIAWLALRGGSGSGETDTNAAGEQECVAGDLALPVAAANKTVGEQLVEDYAASHPVVRDYCVTPKYVEKLEDAAVYVAPLSPITTNEITAAGRSAANNEPPAVYASAVGLAGPADKAGAPALADVVFPTTTQPEASAIASQKLADSDQAAADALKKQHIPAVSDAAAQQDKLVATTEDNAPEGTTFTPLDDAQLVYSAIPLNTTDSVNEEQTRAAQAFGDYAGKTFTDANGDVVQDMSGVSEPVWSAAEPEGGKRVTDPEAQTAGSDQPSGTQEAGAPGEPADTLFLLDTSAGMAEFNDPAAEAIDAAIGEITSGGHSVALWNYSSPLTPGVNKGYRANVAFTGNADDATGTAFRFVNDGQPQTREAVAAAVDYAQTEATPENPVRIVLITSGSVDSADDSALQALKEAKAKGIDLTIVRVGSGEADNALIDAASFTSQAPDAAALPEAVRSAAGLS